MLHLKRLHFYEARLSAYEAFCGVAAKYEAPQMRYEAKPFQASYFFALKSRQKNGGERGIRTLGTLRYTTFPMWRLRPLDHLSAVQRFNNIAQVF